MVHATCWIITLSYLTYFLYHEHFDRAETISGIQIHTNLLSEQLSNTVDTVDSSYCGI